MNWLSWRDFFAMGGYGFYIWISYGVCFSVLALEVWQLRASGARQRAAIENLPRNEGRLIADENKT